MCAPAATGGGSTERRHPCRRHTHDGEDGILGYRDGVLLRAGELHGIPWLAHLAGRDGLPKTEHPGTPGVGLLPTRKRHARLQVNGPQFLSILEKQFAAIHDRHHAGADPGGSGVFKMQYGAVAQLFIWCSDGGRRKLHKSNAGGWSGRRAGQKGAADIASDHGITVGGDADGHGRRTRHNAGQRIDQLD